MESKPRPFQKRRGGHPAPSVPAQFLLAIPPDIASRKYALRAMGLTASDQNVDSDAIWIDVERPDMPVSISASTSSLNFSTPGQELPVILLGTFADGAVLHVTESTYVTYASSDTSIATVDTRGIVTAAGPGRTYITATYTVTGRSVRANIPAEVLARR